MTTPLEAADNVTAEQLEQLLQRIERLTEEKKGFSDDIKDVYAEAKSTGFDTKGMRRAIKRRAMDRDARAEQDAIDQTYNAALGID